MNMDFYNPVNLITGEDCVQKNSDALASLGKRCYIVTGKSSARRSGALADLEAALEKEGIAWELYDEVEPNPMLEGSRAIGEKARAFKADFIVGIGGGSPLDAAKAVAVFAANPMPAMDIYQYNWPNKALPIVAIGTTAGTGSEVGPFAVMTMPNGLKNSVSHPQCYPTLAFGDPKYTWSLPVRFTVSTGLDAICHAMEGYFNVKANAMSDLFAVQAIRILYPALSRLVGMEEDAEIAHDIREQLYYGSVIAGLTLAKCGTCYCHRLGYFLTEQYDVAHGTACAVFLPQFIRRAHSLMKERSVRFFHHADCTMEELCALVERLVNYTPTMKLKPEEIQEIVGRGIGTGNFLNTAPAGLSTEEATQVMTSMFSE